MDITHGAPIHYCMYSDCLLASEQCSECTFLSAWTYVDVQVYVPHFTRGGGSDNYHML